VVGDHRLTHIFQSQALHQQPIRIQFDANRRQCATADVHLPDPINLGQALGQQGRRQIVEFATRQHIGRERQNQYGLIGRVDLAVSGCRGHAGGQQGQSGLDGGRNIACRAVDVAAELKLQTDPGVALGGIRAHLGHARNRTQRATGVATVAAMVSGLAPGKLAVTEMVGNSTWGKGATGN
jgi:hypothetical protein